MRVIKTLAVLAMALCAIAPAASAEDALAPDEMTGVKVGEKAPDFKLTGADGETYALSEMVKEGTVALVFYRSANW